MKSMKKDKNPMEQEDCENDRGKLGQQREGS